jgi:hypothetical protein
MNANIERERERETSAGASLQNPWGFLGAFLVISDPRALPPIFFLKNLLNVNVVWRVDIT